LIANRQPFQDGDYLVPQGAGFGLELDWDYVERYRSEPQS
jgi:L-alanine-DL-glutamate epimerase-like enolase superfamily enzyme